MTYEDAMAAAAANTVNVTGVGKTEGNGGDRGPGAQRSTWTGREPRAKNG